MGTRTVATPVITVDVVMARQAVGGMEIALIERQNEPFAGMWALPGGKLEAQDDSLEATVVREVREETGVRLERALLRQLHCFSEQERDPRGRYLSVLYLAPLQSATTPLHAGDDASDARWFPLTDLPRLAFDHLLQLTVAVRYLHVHAVAIQESSVEALRELVATSS
jgi:8-oxo-dGTP diphosphatase